MALARGDRVTRPILYIVLSSFLAIGCTGDIVELTTHDGGGGPPPSGDMAGGGGGDMAGGGGDGGGVPSNPTFVTDVEPVLISHGCNAPGACHGNGTQVPVLSTDVNANYTSIKAETTKNGTGANCMLMTHLLPGAGHTGGQLFTGTTDPLYQTWLTWVNNGAPLQ